MRNFCPTYSNSTAHMGIHLVAVAALSLPLLWPDSMVQDWPLIRSTDPDPAEAYSESLFKYTSLVFVIWTFFCEIRTQVHRVKLVAETRTELDNYFSPLMWPIPPRSLIGILIPTLLSSAAIVFYDFNGRGDGVSVPLFLLETLPLTLMVVVTTRAYRVGAVSPGTLLSAVASLLLIPMQFRLTWLILPLVFGSWPAMLLWTLVTFRAMIPRIALYTDVETAKPSVPQV